MEHSSVNIRLMLNNILRRKLCDLSECSQLEEHSTNSHVILHITYSKINKTSLTANI